MPTKLIPVGEARRIQSNVLTDLRKLSNEGKHMNGAQVMEKLLIFMEFQYGTKVPGKPYQMRDNHQIDNKPLIGIRLSLGNMCLQISDFERALTHALAALEMLKNRIIGCTVDEIALLFAVESLLTQIHICRSDHLTAQHHAEQALIAARRYSGPERISFIYQALKKLAGILKLLSCGNEAVTLSEEAYELVSGVHALSIPMYKMQQWNSLRF